MSKQVMEAQAARRARKAKKAAREAFKLEDLQAQVFDAGKNLMLASLGGIGSVVARAFERMEIAEEEIAAEKDRMIRGTCTKHQIDRVQAAFQVMCPSPVLHELSLEVYRAHAKEMVIRVRDEQDTRPATKAEAHAAMLFASLTAPLHATAQGLAEKLFAELYPDQVDRVLVNRTELAREPYTGAHEEVLRDVRRRFTVADRVMRKAG